ncbi:MAG: histidine kinase N-terminal 7TM domain-containing protein [Oscillospiraceae bacterium]|nr:histidine kinase N-terminal 7TM domain-containing protein [Oscillospiraceae bacterium]
MISNTATVIFCVILFILGWFLLWLLRYRGSFLLKRLFVALSACYFVWVVALLMMKLLQASDTTGLFVLDSLTYVGVSFCAVVSMVIALAFTKSWEKLPRWCWLLLIMPVLTNLMVWTNPLHHFYYLHFSVIRSELKFGPGIYISGIYNYACLIVDVLLMLRFIFNSQSSLYTRLGVCYILGAVIPLVVSIMATLGIGSLTIAATPLSFVATLLFYGIAIYQLHLLDIRPIATQHVLDGISDCYLVLSDQELVLNLNQPFREVFGKQYNIVENCYLSDCAKEEDRQGKTPIYNLLTAVETCKHKQSSISYEQPLTTEASSGTRRQYYIAEVSPLWLSERLAGYVCIFKDITALKNSMQQLENGRTRMMEQERLAFLGQMVGGLAHNLKTPIMSISGCGEALSNLVMESRQSLDDPGVNSDDYREIYGEMDSWVARIREACAYMSDIITAIKGQAAHASASEDSTFSLSDLLKRVALLMGHELVSSGCQLVSEQNMEGDFTFHGDINNLIQVLNNLISNAIYAQKQVGGGKIVLGVRSGKDTLSIYVRDTGPGVEPRVRDRIFREMITSKGTQGTGLGLYISNAVVRGKFGGTMWVEDNPGGGAVFGLSIPLESMTLIPADSAGKEDKT